MEQVILRKPSVSRRLGDAANSTLYDWVRRRVLTPPLKIGLRASGWPESEIDAIVAARISGAGEAEIRKLVAALVAKRTVGTPGLARAKEAA
jgi:prophage regulatory protein